MNLVYLVILGVGLPPSVSLWRLNYCKEPNIGKILKDIPHLYEETLDPSFLNLPRLKPIISRKNRYTPRFHQKKWMFYGGFRTCSEGRRVIRNHGGNLCPSYYRLERDPDRIPRELIQASCACSSCFLLQRQTRRLTSGRRSVRHLGCRKVYVYRQVARRAGCIKRVWKYRLYWEKVSVACTCSLSDD